MIREEGLSTDAWGISVNEEGMSIDEEDISINEEARQVFAGAL
jgi:hypothetical protein